MSQRRSSEAATAMSSEQHVPRGLTTTRRGGVVLLVAGGIMSALNGAVHFVLPVVYPWAEHVEGLYGPVRWALYATTVFFGILLVFGGVVTVAVAVWREVPWRVVALVGGGMAGFWTIGAVYELLVPFPAPVASWALPLFSTVVALVYLVGLWLHRPDDARAGHGRAGPDPSIDISEVATPPGGVLPGQVRDADPPTGLRWSKDRRSGEHRA